jgi:nicotinamide mononucleotide adenylyltransferase
MSIRYLVPEPVADYIEDNNLYEEDGTSSEKGKEQAAPAAGTASSSGSGSGTA